MTTVKEIAKIAQVSPATVSLVLNGKDGVGWDTRQRILEIVAQVGYVHKSKTIQPNPISSITRGNIRFIKYKDEGMLVERNGDFITRVIDGIEDAARIAGLNLNITNVGPENFQSRIARINEQKDDGIIFLGTEFPERDAEILCQLKAPVVVIDNELPLCEIDCVVMNNQQAVFKAIGYLKQLGHRQIGHIRSNCRIENFKSRDFAFHKVMRELELEIQESFVVDVAPDIESSYFMMLDYLKEVQKLPTAFFADNDILAIGALRALKQAGKKIPQDISIIGIDDLMMSSVSEPKLTTVRIFKHHLGEVAVQRLQKKMEQKEENVPLKILTGTKLVIRESTAVLSENII